MPDGAKSLTSVVQEYEGGQRHVARVGVRASDVQSLLTGPEVRARSTARNPHPAYLSRWQSWEQPRSWCSRCHYQRQLSGIIALGERFDLVPTEEDRMQMRRLADQAAVALANARMLDQVRELAYFDSLTGLPNRLSYKERLAYALEQASRNQQSGRRLLYRPRQVQQNQRHAGPRSGRPTPAPCGLASALLLPRA